MTQLNPKIYFIDDEISERDCSVYTVIPELLIKQPYYYIEFRLYLNKLPELLTGKILLSLMIGLRHLVLVNSHEAFHSIVTEIYDVAVERLQIPPGNITLFSESADIHSEIKRVAKLRNLPEIKAVWVHLFESVIKSELARKEFDDNVLPIKDYPKSFLNFNRRWRMHRPTLVALFYSLGILDKGYVSLGKTIEDSSWKDTLPVILYHTKDTPELINLLLSKKEEILNLPPLYLDIENLHENPTSLEPETQYLYLNSYFSVVSETNFYKAHQPGRFLSEKVFKPIAMCHPFIIVSVPKTLSLLREIGYKTFSPWINESYDEENNDNKRLLMIAEETKRLSNLNKNEITEFINNVRGICLHNRDILLNKVTFHKELN